MDVAVALGMVLRRVRIEKDFTQEELALRAGLDSMYVSILELANYQMKVTTILKWAGIRATLATAELNRELVAAEQERLAQEPLNRTARPRGALALADFAPMSRCSQRPAGDLTEAHDRPGSAI